jgi:ParB family chromosome partitioning protein
MNKDRRLGRGLAALLGTPIDEEVRDDLKTDSDLGLNEGSETSPKAPSCQADTLQLNVYEIDDNPFQPRREFSVPEIASLSESLKEHDMLQPVLVRRTGDRFQLISGERRLRAAIQAGWSTVPARIREADDRLVAELAIVENLQRKDLNPIEKAMSFRRYLDEHDCKQDDLANRLKIDRSTIANLMRLLELPDAILDGVREGNLSAGHARALLPLGHEQEQVAFGERIRREGLSVRATEKLVQEALAAEEADSIAGYVGTRPPQKQQPPNDQIGALEQELRMALGTRIEIRQTSRGRGRIIVHFGNHGEFERLRERLTDSDPAVMPDAA